MNPTQDASRFSQRLSRRRMGRHGFTLVEIVVSLVILGLLSLGIISATLQVRRSAEATMRESNAHAVAMGFIEQLQGMDYTVLLSLAQSNNAKMRFIIRDGTPLEVPLNVANGDYDGPHDIPINVGADGEDSISMPFWIQANVVPSGNELPSLDICLRYRWLNPHTNQESDGELMLVRARTQN